MSIQVSYIKQADIDRAKWDRCIEQAENGLIYAYAMYLDCMAAHWDALVLNDYEMVMPLTWNKKYGFYYLYQPFLSASLGLFGNNVTEKELAAFLQAIPRKFKLWEFSLNHGNVFRVPPYHLFERMNYVLALKDDYTTLYTQFRENVKRNIKKSEKLGAVVKTGIPVEAVIAIAEAQMQSFAKVKEGDFENFRKLFYHLYKEGKAVTYGIIDQQEHLLASAVFFFSHNRAYYILVGNHPNGKTLGAGHALINAFIKDHAGKPLLLDFEGSDIGNIAFFYSSFGAREEKYSAIVYNKLPSIVNWLKSGFTQRST